MKKFLPLILCIFGLVSLINTQDTPTTTTTTTPPTANPPTTTSTTPPTTTPTTPTTTTTPQTSTTPTTTPTTPTTTTPTTPQCALNFYGTPPAPACTPITDANGVQYDCAVQNGTPSSTVLNKVTKAITVAEGSFYEMDFDGTCSSCILYLFNKPNFAGAFVAYPLTRAKYSMLLSYNVWRVPFTSFKVICSKL